MTTIETAHLFVEKYSKANQEILLDFVREDEFIYFKQNADYLDTMHLSYYEPTMLLIHNCNPSKKIREGSLLTVRMDKLLSLNREQISFENYINQRQEGLPAVVFLEIHNGEAFADLIDSTESTISTYVREEFIHNLSSNWNGPPCALERIHDHFELRIWDVGQGNTISISDDCNLALFDFGASIYYSKDKLKSILVNHNQLLNKSRRCSLIISHWDIDHYNFLTVIDDEFLENICCIFYPSTVVTLTAQLIVKRLEAHCRYRVSIESAPCAVKRKCGIQSVISGKHYTLFTGEQSQSCNHSGLLLALYSNTQNALLTADHSNYQIWGKAYNFIDKQKLLHIVVPHHGGDCGKPTVPSIAHPGKAVISVGSNNYGHPKVATIRQYRNEKFDLVRTDRRGVDIVINMN